MPFRVLQGVPLWFGDGHWDPMQKIARWGEKVFFKKKLIRPYKGGGNVSLLGNPGKMRKKAVKIATVTWAGSGR